jgi:GNAT superfamily N-acetyltransferase
MVYIARRPKRLIATFSLSTRKPWAIDPKYFSSSKRPLYLTSMAVHPDGQRQGLGRLCIQEARRIATALRIRARPLKPNQNPVNVSPTRVSQIEAGAGVIAGGICGVTLQLLIIAVSEAPLAEQCD